MDSSNIEIGIGLDDRNKSKMLMLFGIIRAGVRFGVIDTEIPEFFGDCLN